jgi:membrane associated rhomboid family serine protease
VLRREPIFNAPPSMVWLLAVLALVHGARLLLNDQQDTQFVLSLAFIPARYAGDGAALPGGRAAAVTSFLTYMAVHGDMTHLLVNGASLLAFGSVMVRRLGSVRFLLFSAACGVAGALAYLVLHPGAFVPMIGASGANSGLLGGLLRFLFSAVDRRAAGRPPEAPQEAPRWPLRRMLTDRRSIGAILAFVVANLMLSLGLGGLAPPGSIAWEVHLGGFCAGVTIFGLFDGGARTEARVPVGGD